MLDGKITPALPLPVTARHEHLVRVARTAGEAFACPPSAVEAPRRVSGAGLLWLALSVAAGATLVLFI